MSLHSEIAAAARPAATEPAYVDAELHYLLPTAERVWNYACEPPQGVARSNAVHRPYPVRVWNARPRRAELSLDRQGFALVEHRSATRDFYDEDALKRVYYPEAEALVAEASGAKRVIVFDHTIRRRISGLEDRTAAQPRQPVPRVHNDYTVKSGPQRVRDLLGDEAEGLLRGRFAVVNVWRPIRGPLRDMPLAVCDAGSVAFSDFVPSDLIYRDRTGETYQVTYSPAHRWSYVPAMEEDEAVLIKCYDSATDGRARFSPHCAFADPTAPADILPRESIELRTLAFY
jgi:hypothetical protein